MEKCIAHLVCCRVEQRNKLIAATIKLCNRLLLSSWNSWRLHACNKQLLRSTLQHAVQQWTCARLRAGLAAFMSHHERVVRATAAVARWRQAEMSKAFEVGDRAIMRRSESSTLCFLHCRAIDPLSGKHLARGLSLWRLRIQFPTSS